MGPTPPPFGGVSVHIHRLEAILRASNVAHEIISTTKGGSSLGLARLLPMFCSIFRARGNAVVIHSSGIGAFMVARLFGMFGASVALHLHNGRWLKKARRSRVARALTSWMIRRLDHLYVANDEIKRDSISLGMSPEAIETLAAFLPPTPEELRGNNFELEAGTLAVGWCGLAQGPRAHIYGLDFFLDVLEALLDQGLSVRGIIATPDAFDLRAMAPERSRLLEKLRNHLVLLPQDAPFSSCLSGLRLFVRPTSSDGDAVSIREALYAGVPVLTSDVVERPASCVIYPHGDLKAATMAAARMLLQERSQTGVRVQPQARPEYVSDKPFHSLSHLIRTYQGSSEPVTPKR